MILKVSDINFKYKSIKILENINFNIEKGKITMILGPNGVGKTTLLKCLNKVLKPDDGEVYIDKKPVSRMNIKEVALYMSYVAQKNDPVKITVFDAVLMGRLPHHKYRTAKNDHKKVNSIMEKLNLSCMGLKNLDELSGGELQQVAIARALTQETEILLMDEPTSSLDLSNQSNILNIIRRIALEHDIAVIMTMHDLNAALRYGDKYICLKDKTIFRAGDIENISSDIIEQVYGLPVDIVKHKGFPLVVPMDTEKAA
ncbi:MAG: ABC transporter ATP-binding protein [Desulfobacterales bacterium]|nr:ABC transporter ATP-binding protein [Desulfobacterales bacterium]MCP4162236.1 ABC transporter ATP-binding protein [Deltaproteobacteria bacterium]